MFAITFSSCALLKPSASVQLLRIPSDFELGATDTTKTVLFFDSNINVDFDLSGSKRVAIHPGVSQLLADGISPGWYYVDVVGANTWVRGLPVYLNGGDSVSFDIGSNHLGVDGRTFFSAFQEKSTRYSFTPMLSLNCFGCTARPLLKFDRNQVDYVPPWVAVSPGWHTIEIYSPFDNVQLYYRTLFDNFTVTQFNLYPIRMN